MAPAAGRIPHARYAVAHDVKLIAVAVEFCRFSKAAAAEANDVATDFVDLEPVLHPIQANRVTALAFACDLDIIGAVIKPHSGRKWKCRRQTSSAPPCRREAIRNVEQQRRECGLRMRIPSLGNEIGPVSFDEGSGGLAGRKFRMPQARGKKRLIGPDPERDCLLEAVNESAPRLFAGCAM